MTSYFFLSKSANVAGRGPRCSSWLRTEPASALDCAAVGRIFPLRTPEASFDRGLLVSFLATLLLPKRANLDPNDRDCPKLGLLLVYTVPALGGFLHFGRIGKGGDLFQAPNPVGKTCFHRRGDSQRLVNPSEVVE